jgi:hypothetical protein
MAEGLSPLGHGNVARLNDAQTITSLGWFGYTLALSVSYFFHLVNPPNPRTRVPYQHKRTHTRAELFQYDKYSWYTINKDIEKLGKRQTQPEPQTPQ